MLFGVAILANNLQIVKVEYLTSTILIGFVMNVQKLANTAAALAFPTAGFELNRSH